MGIFLEPADLDPFASIDTVKAAAMIEDAEAMAVLAAPCLAADPETITDAQAAAVRAILRGAILRWNEAGTGALASVTTGPFGETIDTRQPRRGMFWPSEITQLGDICKNESGGAFSIDTIGCGGVHSQICALYFGATYCSCGADIAGSPLYEVI